MKWPALRITRCKWTAPDAVPRPVLLRCGRAYRFAAGVTDSNYTVSVAGDNLERWRVWAINEDGTPGNFSDWRTFDVDSSGAVR